MKTDTINFREQALKYKNELNENIIPFWAEHSVDLKNGGYFTCLDREGNVFDSDKFVWLQARQVWLFSMLFNKEEKNLHLLEIANKGAEFLHKYGFDHNYDWYFSLDAVGNPLIQPYNIFSNVFGAMAFAQFSQATNDDHYANIALKTFQRILERKENPKGIYNKSYPGTRNLKNFALPMILCNLSLEIAHLLPKELVDETVDTAINEVMHTFYNKNYNLILENVQLDGSFSDSFEGRLLNPGHAIEAMWFIMDLGKRKNDMNLVKKAVQIVLDTLNYSWDKQYGGIYYFMDVKGRPPQQLEWNQKLWWVHIETLIALLKGYELTGNQECLNWYTNVENYTWEHFKDKSYGEWFGYLDRSGKVLLPLKGGKWKGCFHVPRGMYQCWKSLERISNNN